MAKADEYLFPFVDYMVDGKLARLTSEGVNSTNLPLLMKFSKATTEEQVTAIKCEQEAGWILGDGRAFLEALLQEEKKKGFEPEFYRIQITGRNNFQRQPPQLMGMSPADRLNRALDVLRLIERGEFANGDFMSRESMQSCASSLIEEIVTGKRER